jgi:hypothetical protein
MYLGDIHLHLMAGGAFYVAGGLGGSIGSPYLQVGGQRSRVALAVRANIDFVFGQTSGGVAQTAPPLPGKPVTYVGPAGDTYGGIAITPHLNVSVALAHNVTLQGHVGIGFMPGGSVKSGTVGHDPMTFYFETHVEGWVGVRL